MVMQLNKDGTIDLDKRDRVSTRRIRKPRQNGKVFEFAIADMSQWNEYAITAFITEIKSKQIRTTLKDIYVVDTQGQRHPLPIDVDFPLWEVDVSVGFPCILTIAIEAEMERFVARPQASGLMTLSLRSSVTGDILTSIRISPSDTVDQLLLKTASELGLDASRHRVMLLLPEHQCELRRGMSLEAVDIADGAELQAIVQRAKEVSLIMNLAQYDENMSFSEACDHRDWYKAYRKGYVRNLCRIDQARFERISQKSGCSWCDVAVEQKWQSPCWSICFRGTPAEVGLAEKSVREFREKGYTSMFYDDFAQRRIRVDDWELDNICSAVAESHHHYSNVAIFYVCSRIGHEFDVVLNVNMKPERGRHSILVAGCARGVAQAVRAFRELLTNYHHPKFLPDWVHAECCVPPVSWALLVSLCLSLPEINHVERNWGVLVLMPPSRVKRGKLVILGHSMLHCEAAKAYVEQLAWEACEKAREYQRLGRDAVERWGISDEAIDHWGEEAPDEEWMLPYMYRCKEVCVGPSS